MTTLHRVFLLALALAINTLTFAYDFSADNEGQTIYYNITSDSTCAVTYAGENHKEIQSYSGEVIIPSTVAHNGKVYTVIYIGAYAFYDCSSLTSVEIPGSVILIKFCAFEWCSSLTSMDIPNSVSSIESGAFFGCSSLTSVDIPNSVTSIENNAFAYCSSLTSVEIPNSVTSIGDAAFSGCSSLTSFTGKFASDDHRCLIVNGVLNACAPAGLMSYKIPDFVTSIGVCAFYDCSSLTSMEIPNSVTSIGRIAFYGCSNLASFTGKFASDDHRCLIVDGVLNSFASAGLMSYEIPNSVTSIGESAFSWCIDLESIVIPCSVTIIGDYAFKYCLSLKSLYVRANTPPTNNFGIANDDDGVYSKCTLYVPCKSIEAYRNATGWKEFESFEPYEVKVEDVGGYVAVAVDGELDENILRKVVDLNPLYIDLSHTEVESLADGAFEKCSDLAAVKWFESGEANVNTLGCVNPNLLFYCADKSIAPSDAANVIVDGKAERVLLRDLTEEEAALTRGNFYCPEPFEAKRISYEHSYGMNTGRGSSEGWETLALPFDVQNVYNKTKGTGVVPFGKYDKAAGAIGSKPFWLYEFDGDAFVPAASISAGKPYIVSMPNNDAYLAEYNIPGKVSFYSEDVNVAKTELQAEGEFVPAMTHVSAAENIYAINKYEEVDGYNEGSVFVSELRDVRPFEAYFVSADTRQKVIRISDISGGKADGIEEVTITTNADALYNLQGQRVDRNYRGIVISNGQKVLNKR